MSPGGWHDYVTLLHPPYTVWHLSYVAMGAAVASQFNLARLGATLVAFFLGVGVTAHAFARCRDANDVEVDDARIFRDQVAVTGVRRRLILRDGEIPGRRRRRHRRCCRMCGTTAACSDQQQHQEGSHTQL